MSACDGGADPMVRVDVLRRFDTLVASLGGDADRMLAPFQLDASILAKPHAAIPYRTLANLLERAAMELDCPDFGMRLAALQGGAKVLGPLGVAMQTSRVLREAFAYCAEHMQAFSDGTQISLVTDRKTRATVLRFDILLADLPYRRQAVEQAMLLVQHNIQDLSSKLVRAREIWFSHEPLAPRATYQAHFGVPVKFGCSLDGAVFADADLDIAVAGCDPQIHELATTFIDLRYPPNGPAMTARVRAAIERALLNGDAAFSTVASAMGMHTRTLQRRLRAEGMSFEGLKDVVRRDMALRYLTQSSLSIARISELVGYSETSVLSRSCDRWFASSPRQLREEARSRLSA